MSDDFSEMPDEMKRKIDEDIKNSSSEKSIFHDSLYIVSLREMQKNMRPNDLFFKCDACGRIPKKCTEGAKVIGPSPDDKPWWGFYCPGCKCYTISVLWRM